MRQFTAVGAAFRSSKDTRQEAAEARPSTTRHGRIPTHEDRPTAYPKWRKDAPAYQQRASKRGTINHLDSSSSLRGKKALNNHLAARGVFSHHDPRKDQTPLTKAPKHPHLLRWRPPRKRHLFASASSDCLRKSSASASSAVPSSGNSMMGPPSAARVTPSSAFLLSHL